MSLLSRSLFAAVSLVSLASCGPDRNVFAPACPDVRFVQPLADLTRFRPGGGQDITDLVLQGRMQSVSGKCEYGETKDQLQTTVTVTLALQRGVAMQGRTADVAAFVAVTDGDVVRDKHVYSLHMELPPNIERTSFTSPPIDITLPISPTKSGAAYGIIAGFQLSPEELAINRRQATR